MKRIHLLVVGLLVVLGACGDDSSVPASDGGSTTTEAVVSTQSDTPASTSSTTTTTTTTIPEPTEPLAVWASDTTNGVVIAFDPVTFEVLFETEVENGVESFAFGAESAWVVGNAAGAVYRIDAVSGAFLATVATGPNAAGIVYDDGVVHVANFGTGPDFASTVTMVDPATLSVIDTIEVGSGATGMTSGSAIGVTFRSGEVYRIDGSAGFVAMAPVADGLSEVVAAGGDVFITAPSTGQLHRVDRDTLEVELSVPVGSTPNFIAYGGGRLWVSDSGGTVWSVDPDSLDAEAVVDVPSPMGIDAVELDGTTWVFVGSWTGGVYRFDAADPAGSLAPAFMGSGSIFDVAVSGGG